MFKILLVIMIGCFEIFVGKTSGFEGANQVMNTITNLFGKIDKTTGDLDKTLGTIGQLTDRTKANSDASQSKLGNIIGKFKKDKIYRTPEECSQRLQELKIKKQKLDEMYQLKSQEIAEEAALIKESMIAIETSRKAQDIKNKTMNRK